MIKKRNWELNDIAPAVVEVDPERHANQGKEDD